MWGLFLKTFGRGFDSRHLQKNFLKIFKLFTICYIYNICIFFFLKYNIFFYKKIFNIKIKNIFYLKSLIYKNLKDDYFNFLTYKIIKT